MSDETPTYNPEIAFDGHSVGDAEVKTVGDLATRYKSMRESAQPSDGSSWGPPGIMGEDAQRAARDQFYQSDLGKEALKSIKAIGATKKQAETIQSSFFAAYQKQAESAAAAQEGMKKVITDRFGGDENFKAWQTANKEKHGKLLDAMGNNPAAFEFASLLANVKQGSAPTTTAGGGSAGSQDTPSDAPEFTFQTKQADGTVKTETRKLNYTDRKVVGNFLAEAGNTQEAKRMYAKLREMEMKHEAEQRKA